MSQAPFHNRAQFEKSVERLIQRADKQNRGSDLDRVVQHLSDAPAQVSKLASLLTLVDEDYRAELKQDVDAYRRFESQKGRTPQDDEIVGVMLEVYRRVRG